MQMTVRKRLWIISILLLFISAAIALYFISPYIAQYSLQRWLHQQGFSEVSLDMAPPLMGALQINNFSLQQHTSEKTLTLNTGPLRIEFEPTDLFLKQRFQLIELPRSSVDITYHTTETQADQESALLDLSHLLPEKLFKKLPVGLLRVGQLDLTLNYPSPLPNWSFSGALLLDDDLLYSRVRMQRHESFESTDLTKDLGWADLELTPHNSFHLRLLEKDEPFFVTTGNVGFESTLSLSSMQVVDLKGLQSWATKFLPTDSVSIPHLTGSLTSSGVTHFPVKTLLSPDALLASIETKQVIQSKINVTNPPAGENVTVDKVSINIDGVLDYNQHALQLSLSPQSFIDAKNIKHDSLAQPLSSLEFKLKDNLDTALSLSSFPDVSTADLTVHPFKGSIKASTIKLPDAIVNISPIHMDVESLNINEAVAKTNIVIGKISGQHQAKALPTFSLNTHLNLKQDQLSSYFTLKGLDVPLSLSGHSKGALNGSQKLSWKLKPIALTRLLPVLEPWVEIPNQLTLLSGTLFHHGNGQIKQGNFTGRLTQSIEGLDLKWDETLIEQLTWHSKTKINAANQIRDKGSVKLERVKTGVEITKVQASYEYEHNKGRDLMEITEGAARLLEGHVSLATTRFDPFSPNIETMVTLDTLDLGAILSLEQQQGLSGQGKLSGSFPLTFKNNVLTIADGSLVGLAPGGRITFLPNPSVLAYAASNSGLKIALEALENFHFDTLDIKLNYLEDGTAHLKTRLKGNNPDWNDGHPIDFTINIEENIPKLLQTLQFTDKLTKSIEKRYR